MRVGVHISDGPCPYVEILMRKFTHPTRLLILLAVAACAGSGRSGPRRDPNLITLQELNEVSDRSAYDAVDRLRPSWLIPRGRSSGIPAVIWDGRPYRLDILRTMPLEQVQEMAYITALDATTLYGTGYPSGAIRVTSRRTR
jgi:hypothetical protein